MKRTQRTYRGYVHRDDSTEDGDGKPLRIVAATAGRKADGLNLQMEGADLGRFQANPIMGYGHMYWGRDSLPIGRSDETWIDDDKLMMDVSFDQDDEFGRTVERKYRKGYLNTFSIGFDAEVDDNGLVNAWELFEVSAVPLPMDPDAAVESGRDQELMLARALEGVRAGAVLSKKNKKLVQDAAQALNALLKSADGKDDDGNDEDEDDEERAAREARLLRLAGICPT